MLEKLTVDDFAALHGQSVRLRVGEQILQAEVAEAKSVPNAAPEGFRQSFSVIILAGSPERFWPQGTYVFEHPEHGDLELFMVPLGPQGERMRYEINFS